MTLDEVRQWLHDHGDGEEDRRPIAILLATLDLYAAEIAFTDHPSGPAQKRVIRATFAAAKLVDP